VLAEGKRWHPGFRIGDVVSGDQGGHQSVGTLYFG
jgi:hypothetical protein